jgi:acetyl-CoA C-acetyltransferase
MHEKVAVIGVGWTEFQSATPELSYKELMYAAAVRAYSDAGVDPRRDIESFVTVAEDFQEGTSIFDEYTPDQLGAALKPMHTISGDGLHGLATAYMLIRTGQFAIVAVEAHSKASNILTLPEVTAYAQDPTINRPLNLNTHFIAGLEMNRYLHETGSTVEQCSAVVIKNRRNALQNPIAPYGAELTVDEIRAAPALSWPLNTLQASEHADGAIVMVLAREDVAQRLCEKPIWILGVGWCSDSPALEYRDWGRAIYAQQSANMAFRQAGIRRPSDAIDLAEVDDTYAYKELQSLEAMELYSPGTAGPATAEGATQKDGEAR